MEPNLREQLTQQLMRVIPQNDGPSPALECEGNVLAEVGSKDFVDVDRIVGKAIYDLQRSLLKEMKSFDFDFSSAIEEALGEKIDERMLLRMGLIEEWQVEDER